MMSCTNSGGAKKPPVVSSARESAFTSCAPTCLIPHSRALARSSSSSRAKLPWRSTLKYRSLRALASIAFCSLVPSSPMPPVMGRWSLTSNSSIRASMRVIFCSVSAVDVPARLASALASSKATFITSHVLLNSAKSSFVSMSSLQSDTVLGCRQLLFQQQHPQLVRIRIWQSGGTCLLYTSDAADERSSVDLGG